MKLAIVGAPGTGKTRLTQDLELHLPGLQFSDSPSPESLQQAGAFDRVLLMGLDLPGMAPAQQEADVVLRTQLEKAAVAYGVVYGSGRERLRAALRLIDPQDGPPPRWTGPCERCADPECEFQLFTALLSSKGAGRPPS